MDLKGTTICAIRRDGKTAIAGDGQVQIDRVAGIAQIGPDSLGQIGFVFHRKQAHDVPSVSRFRKRTVMFGADQPRQKLRAIRSGRRRGINT